MLRYTGLQLVEVTIPFCNWLGFIIGLQGVRRISLFVMLQFRNAHKIETLEI